MESESQGPDADLPWLQQGAVRRDCQPHRGKLLLVAATVAVGLAFLSELLLIVCAGAVHFEVPWLAVCHTVILTIGLAGLGLGFSVWRMARRDLSGMLVGTVDPNGEGPTWVACRRGAAAAFISLVVVAGWGAVIFIRMMPTVGWVVIPAGLCALVVAVHAIVRAAPEAARRLREQYRRRGLLAVATVQTISRSEGSGWHVQYRFSDATGRQYRFYVECREAEKPAVGDTIQIVYLPEDPRFSTPAANYLEAEASDETPAE
jgi:hypothetical protein